jgi:hypothetical protein
MRIDELDIHPLAQAVLRYFTVPQAAEASQLTPDQVIEHVGRALNQLEPAELKRAGTDLLDVSRFLRRRDQNVMAERVAKEISRAVTTKLVEHGASGSPQRTERSLPPLPAREPHHKEPLLLHSKWASMSEASKQKLAKLADELIQRTESSAEESAPTRE